MILGTINQEAKKQGLDKWLSGEETFMKILEYRGHKLVNLQNNGLVLQLPLETPADDFQKIVKLSEEVKEKEKSEIEIEFEQKLGNGNKLPNFGQIKKVFEEGTVELAAKQGQVLLIDVWATWCGPCQKPMAHNQTMLEKNNWGDNVRIVGVSVDDEVDVVKNRVQTKGWQKVQHLTLGGWDHGHSLIKSFAISGIPFVCLVDTHGNIVFTGHPSSINLEQKINELLKESANSNAPLKKQQDLEVSVEQIKKLSATLADNKFFEEQFGKSQFISTKIHISSTSNKGKIKNKATIQVYTFDDQKEVFESYQKLLPSKNIKLEHKLVQTVHVPEVPPACTECKGQLKYPLYWCYWSTAPGDFRCRACVEKKVNDKQYHYSQNSILLPAAVKSIGKKHLGKNLQPANIQAVEMPHQFGCNSCGNCPSEIGQQRYLCLGCRSQPNYRGDYVDLCKECLDKYLAGDADTESSLTPDGHEKNHPFLRVLYNVKGYYEF